MRRDRLQVTQGVQHARRFGKFRTILRTIEQSLTGESDQRIDPFQHAVGRGQQFFEVGQKRQMTTVARILDDHLAVTFHGVNRRA
jgi:hypothetical protein